jgi:ribonuclease J
MDGVQDFRGIDVFGYLPPDKVVALCTGSQGEPRAALARIAQNEHPDIALSPGDRVIFSSRTIPGNEKEVGSIINGLINLGIEVITDRTHLVHVSGHPRKAELEDMLRWVRPRIVVPVHGEALHLKEHADVARRVGVPKVIRCRNGDLIRLAPDPGKIDELPSGRVFKDGNMLVSGDARTVTERRRLSFAGYVSVALALTEKGALAADPDLELVGIPEYGKGGKAMNDIAYDAIVETFESLPKAKRRDPDTVAEAVRRSVRGAIRYHWGKKPVCHVHVLEV